MYNTHGSVRHSSGGVNALDFLRNGRRNSNRGFWRFPIGLTGWFFGHDVVAFMCCQGHAITHSNVCSPDLNVKLPCLEQSRYTPVRTMCTPRKISLPPANIKAGPFPRHRYVVKVHGNSKTRKTRQAPIDVNVRPPDVYPPPPSHPSLHPFSSPSIIPPDLATPQLHQPPRANDIPAAQQGGGVDVERGVDLGVGQQAVADGAHRLEDAIGRGPGVFKQVEADLARVEGNVGVHDGRDKGDFGRGVGVVCR